MSNAKRAAAVLLLAGVVVAVLAIKNRNKAGASMSEDSDHAPVPADAVAALTSTNASSPQVNHGTAARLPRLVDLGADKCVPCKMMAPILDELKEEFSGTFEVRFIDVWKNPKAKAKYGVRMIPTQIFYDAEGNELFRHEGFFSRDEILATWKKHGVAAPAGEESSG